MKQTFILALGLAAILFSCTTDHVIPTPENPAAFIEVASEKLGETGAAEISAYDPQTKRLFTVNNELDENEEPVKVQVEVLDLSNFPSLKKLQHIDISSLGGVANSVSVHNGKLAIALEGTNKQTRGKVIVVNTATLAIIRELTVGYLPDMVTFSPDGKYIITANEGEPNQDYTIDPKGSISVIDVSADYAVKTLEFDAFAGTYTELAKNYFRIFGKNTSFSQDIEPEYVAVSQDSKKAFVTLQENNGIAEVDLASGTILKIHPLGVKDYALPGNEIDPSDRDSKIVFGSWPVKSFFLPDAIAAFTVGGAEYLITANEGDAREYDAFDEQARVNSLTLDPTVFPNAATLKQNANLGRLRVTNTLGDTDNDGDYDVLFGFGGRSFSIFKASDMSRIYDSGSELDRKAAEAGVYDDDRSDDKGVEPEGVTVGNVNGKQVAFIALERADAIAIYDVTSPSAPQFLQLLKTGDAPEGVLFIAADKSPNGKSLLVTSNEGDGTVKFYQTN